jgi:hypothetical protein
MINTNNPPRLPSNTQLRGKKALDHLVIWIAYLTKKYEDEGNKYEVNQSELEELSGISRKTIGKYIRDAVSLVDENLSVKKRDSSVAVSALQNQIEGMKEEITDLQTDLNIMRRHHLRIYESLSNHHDSFEAKALLEGIHVEYATSTGNCPLCGDELKTPIRVDSNVISLSKKKKLDK